MPDISKIKHKSTGTVYNIKDATARSGLAGKQDTLTFDSMPTDGSSNPVTSGGVYSAINTAASGNFLVVDSLPTTDISTRTIYLVPKSSGSETGNIYDEYIYVNGKWEKIGETTIDLSGYQKLLTFDSTPTNGSSNPVTSGGVYTALNNKADKTAIPTYTSQLTNDSDYITSSSSITGTAANVTGTVAVGHGGTGATTASEARTNLGLGSASTASTTTSVTNGSSDLVTSGGVYTAILNNIKTENVTTYASWSDSKLLVGVDGVTDSNTVIVGLASSATQEQVEVTAKAMISVVSQGSGSIMLRANGTAPTISLPLTVIIINPGNTRASSAIL